MAKTYDYKTTSALLHCTRFDAEMGTYYLQDEEPEPDRPEGDGWRLVSSIVDGARVLWFWERERELEPPKRSRRRRGSKRAKPPIIDGGDDV